MRLIFLLLFILITPVCFVFAQKETTGVVEIEPRIIDEKLNASEIRNYTVTIKNNTDRKVQMYPMVDDFTAEEGIREYHGPGRADKTVSVASWITLSRGVVDLMPNEEKQLPLELQISLFAKPGKYYARIAFPEGGNRPLAKLNMNTKNFPEITVNIEVEEEIVEKVQIMEFKSIKNIYFKFPAMFSLVLRNFGNRDVVPDGNIYIYNRRGQEIEKIAVNNSKEKISPNQEKKYNLNWGKSGFGKYKAKLEIEYGEFDKRDLQDTVYFWVLPLKYLIVFVVGMLIIIVLSTIFLFKKTYKSHHNAKIPSEAGNGILDLKKK